ncbi:MAG: undecaprenyl-diphosphate phosphatase [Candidatus Colwellbacteria bacterium]|nr:undecaprenyl-diphosphate phosphatase [Candidatus Colwellbacteria bacterium]
MEFLEAIFLGITQGVAEWIPISSEGITVLLGEHLFDGITLTELIRLSLYLHLGTFLAAFIYFRKDVLGLLKQSLHYQGADTGTKRLINFYAVATLVSGIVGIVILKVIERLDAHLDLTTKSVLTGLGIMLLITGIVHLRRRGGGSRTDADINATDGVIAGIAQGVSVIPGISRSGFTIAALLLRNINDTQSLRLSFIMSLPAVLAGNIFLNTSEFALTPSFLISLVLAFGFGLLTIHFLLKLAEKFSFGWFMAVFGVLVLISAWI